MTRKHSQWRDVMHRLFKNRLAIVGLILVAAVLFATIFANFLTPMITTPSPSVTGLSIRALPIHLARISTAVTSWRGFCTAAGCP